jgi:DNA polymerase-4
MDAFYASIEQRDHPEWRGLPLIVGGLGGRGVVAAASYEVRRYGVRSAMPMQRALALCPDAICVRPRMAQYAAVSAQIFDVFRSITPLVEGLSLDEAFLDVTRSLELLGEPLVIAQRIKEEIKAVTGLTASVGLAPNKLLAKIASDLDKPDGLTVVTVDRVHEVLDPLPVRRLPGLGRKKGEQVQAAGIKTLGELRIAPENRLRSLFGEQWWQWQARASGIDEREVIATHEEKTVSCEHSFDTDIENPAMLRAELAALADRLAARLRAKALLANGIGVKIRRHNFETVTRQAVFSPASHETSALLEASRRLLDGWLLEHPGAKLRLLGIYTTGLQEHVQQELFTTTERLQDQRLDAALDAIRGKFGTSAVGRASLIGPADRARQVKVSDDKS